MTMEIGASFEDSASNNLAALYDHVQESETAFLATAGRWSQLPSPSREQKLNASAVTVVGSFNRVINSIIADQLLDTDEKGFIIADVYLKSERRRVEYFSKIAPAVDLRALPISKDEFRDNIVSLFQDEEPDGVALTLLTSFGNSFTAHLEEIALPISNSKKARLLRYGDAKLNRAEGMSRAATAAAARIIMAKVFSA